MTTETKFMPKELSDLDLAFPTKYEELLPPFHEIPEQFKDMNDRSKWSQLVGDWLGSITKQPFDTSKHA